MHSDCATTYKTTSLGNVMQYNHVVRIYFSNWIDNHISPVYIFYNDLGMASNLYSRRVVEYIV